MAYFLPQTHFRETAIVPQHTVLLFIDVQNYNCHRAGALYKAHVNQGKQNVSQKHYGPNSNARISASVALAIQHPVPSCERG